MKNLNILPHVNQFNAMNKDSVTTLEQSRHLIKLGIEPETADMCWTNHLYGCIRSSMRLSSKTINEYKKLLESFYDLGYSEVFEPAWSLTALLKLIPFEHNLHGFNTENGMVYRLESFERVSNKTFPTPFAAVYDMVCWMLENKK